MSWQATAWAVNQKVGSPARKLLLLVLSNYADADGKCWPSQGLLAEQTGMSLDTVQRQTKKLVAECLLSVTRPPKRRGQWQTFIYHLNMPAQNAKPQNAARPSSDGSPDQRDPPKTDHPATGQPDTGNPYLEDNAVQPDRNQSATMPQRQAVPDPKPGRTAMRPNPSREYSIEHSGEPSQQQPGAQTTSDAAARRAAWQQKQNVEVVQDRIARRLGSQGWSMLVELGEADLDRLTRLEQNGRLDDDTLQQVVCQHLALSTRAAGQR
jgi:DNA-binding transcriptional MocR family regulator